MSDRRLHLTDTAIRAELARMKAATERGETVTRVEWVDDVPPFIRVRISHGLAAFYWLGRNPTTRKTERHKLGILGAAMGVKSARDAADAIKGAAHKGKNITKAKREAKRVVDDGRLTVRKMAAAYLARCAADGNARADTTVRNYNRELPALLGEYYDRPLDVLDTELLAELIAARRTVRTKKTTHGATIKVGSAGGALIACKALTTLANEYGLPDPCAELRKKKRLPKAGAKKGRVGTVEGQALYAWLCDFMRRDSASTGDKRAARMLACALLTGWRIGTVAKLEWTHINFKTMSVTYPDNKTGLEIVYPMSQAFADHVRAQPKAGPYVFADVHGKPTAFRYQFIELAPMKFGPNDARKLQTAILSHTPGLVPVAVEVMMGHTSGVTVKNYLLQNPPADVVRAMRPAVDAMAAHYVAKVGHKATIRAMDEQAAEREAVHRQRRRERHNEAQRARRAARKARLAA